MTAPGNGDLDVPAAWTAALDAVAAGVRRVMVVGATDTGKTTFCRWLAAAASRAAVLVDADPGQPGLGPPACAALGRPGEPVERLVFLGVLEPLRARAALLAAAARLTDAGARGGRLVVVNTCGFVRGPGQRLQTATAQAVRPDLVVCLERTTEAAALAEALAARTPVLRLPSSPAVRRKSQAQRRRLRETALAAAFAGAAETRVPADRLPVERLVALAEPLPPRLLCALADAAGDDTALALLLGEDAGSLRLLTAGDPAAAVRLRTGALVVAEDGAATVVPPP
ncbi:Clp1/GlmU family protein [Caenispirillum bisanense]|uniref:Polynucleotide 5'-hydroxyl-kinase GRC3/NOL9 n=1 Tax=Caenispirillum bisanense TaxID=414052 RepID=A0A286GI49_9PROT|nr:Clp1/GlmU family protein [Caenispirillum bisanense]SOD95215.1 polynucleotide 5'-hydroxyl-kinase GRC3/NOL9 [Caenispirillum bisanense]